jgi:two-component system, chemotaxis family, protein-glutamate methylesterase/glutaminase
MSKPAYNILVVDDSSIIRQAIIAIIHTNDELHVVGEASNGYEALTLMARLKPDVVTLDVIMPQMSGLTTLKHIMIFHPTPVVMLSSVTQEGAAITFDALRYGAVDFISKPSKLEGNSLQAQSEEIMQKIITAAKVKTNAIQYVRVNPKHNKIQLPKTACQNIVVLGVAEGGYGSLLKIIPRLVPHSTTVYMVVFYESTTHINDFVDYLNQYSQVRVARPENNTCLEAGVCYLSSGEEYVTVHDKQGDYIAHVSRAPFSSRRGSIDMLMFSVAETVGKNSLGVILTGAGTDGAEGLEEIIRVGGGAIIQSPVSCLYKSMVLSALNVCEAETVVADTEIATVITSRIVRN